MTRRRFWIAAIITLTVISFGLDAALQWRHVRAESPKAAAGSATASSGSDSTIKSPAAEPINKSLTAGGKKPAESDTLLRAYPDDPETVNPITANDSVSEEFMRLVYDSLADRKFGNPDEWAPQLAESWEFDPETLEYTVHLRKGVYWHPMTLPNGKELPKTEVTNKDVKFTFDVMLNENVEAAHIRSYYLDNEATNPADKYKIKVSIPRRDKYTVKVKWTKPYFLAQEYTLGIGIIPEHVFSVDKNGQKISFDYSSKEFAEGFNNHWANNKMCGTGPMRFKEWTRNQRLVLERNPDYWGQPFYFSQMIFQNIKNPNTMVQKMLHNELDWAGIAEKDQYVENQDHANVKSGKVKLAEYRYPQYRYVGYNEKRPLFTDKRVRLALGHAIPVDEIIQKVFHGLAERLTGPFLPGSSKCDSSLKPISYDLDEARRLLDEAGWTLEPGESVRSKMVDGKRMQAKFDLMIYSESPSFASIATIIKENCRQIGVQVQISSTNWALMISKLNKKEFDACILGWAMGWTDDPNQIWSGRQADVPDSSNHIAYKNATVDKLIDKLRVTMDPAKQPPIYQEIHRLIYEDQPYTFLFVDKATAGYDARIENVKFYPIRPCIDTREWTARTARALQ